MAVQLRVFRHTKTTYLRPSSLLSSRSPQFGLALWERAPLIAQCGRSTVIVRPRQYRRSRRIGFGTLLRGEFGAFARGVNAVSLRPAAAPSRAWGLVFLVGLAACAERQALPNDPTGRLFARGLDEITDLYIAPVSSRQLSLGGAARLSRLD